MLGLINRQVSDKDTQVLAKMRGEGSGTIVLLMRAREGSLNYLKYWQRAKVQVVARDVLVPFSSKRLYLLRSNDHVGTNTRRMFNPPSV